MYINSHHFSDGNLRKNIQKNPFLNDPSPLSSDEQDNSHIIIPIEIVRPKAPFPGQMFHGQKTQHDFNDYLIEIFNTFVVDIYITSDIFNKVYEIIKPEFYDSELLLSLMQQHLDLETYISRAVADELRKDIMLNAYSKIPCSLSRSVLGTQTQK